MTDVPSPLKAIVGLVAAAVDRLPEARELPERAVELPVLAVSAFLQVSLRAQQVYAELSARGDEAISQLRGAPEQPPAWASFDDAPDTDGGTPPHAQPEGATVSSDSAATAAQRATPEVPDDFEADVTDDETQIPLDDGEFPVPDQADAVPTPQESARHESGLADGRGPSAFDLTED